MVTLVFDVGKTNMRANVVTRDGIILESVSHANGTVPGEHFAVNDYKSAGEFLLSAIADFGKRHRMLDFIATTHGSYGFLVNRSGEIVPLPDYESTPPEDLNALYPTLIDGYSQRGSGYSKTSVNIARQLLWAERVYPDLVARMDTLLLGPQFWAWYLCGVASADRTMFAAQTHLWNQRDHHFTEMVARCGWTRLMPPMRPSGEIIGRLRPEIERGAGLSSGMDVHCGVHDSTANVYRYQAGGRAKFSLLSTGTWMVVLDDERVPKADDERYDVTLQADALGNSLSSVRSMCGRDFAAIRGEPDTKATVADVEKLVAQETFALPSFVVTSGFVPNSGSRGRIEGPLPETAAERHALAVIYVSLMADLGLDRLGSERDVIVDGVLVSELLFMRLLAHHRSGHTISASRENYGTAIGAALLAARDYSVTPVAAELQTAVPLQLPGLQAYRAKWRKMCEQHQSQP